jgi:hypothetical protein
LKSANSTLAAWPDGHPNPRQSGPRIYTSSADATLLRMASLPLCASQRSSSLWSGEQLGCIDRAAENEGPAALSETPKTETHVSEALAALSEVSRMATLLAGDVLDAQIKGHLVPDNHIQSLLEAILLLREYGAPLPPLLNQIMRKVDDPGP